MLIDTATWSTEDKKKVLSDLGFCALIRFKDTVSALRLFAKDAYISVPTTKEGDPGIVPSKTLLTFMDGFE